MYGTLNTHGGRWLTFTDVRFDEEGTYLVEISISLGYTPDTVSVDVYTPTEGVNAPAIVLYQFSRTHLAIMSPLNLMMVKE